MTEKLKCFLYVLMREELPCGTVARIMQIISKAGDVKFVYSNKGLAEYADEISQKLIQEIPMRKPKVEKVSITEVCKKLGIGERQAFLLLRGLRVRVEE